MEDTPMLLASAGRMEFTGVVRKGLWTAEEDLLLKKCIEKYGDRHWHLVPSRAGLRRCRKSCRLRWLNYLKPNIKRGPFDEDEVGHIIKLHSLLGNRWTLIASRLPGRTANDIKNFWNSRLGKQVGPDYSQGVVQNEVAAASSDVELNPSAFTENSYPLIKQPSQCINPAGAIRGTRPGGSTPSFIVNPQAQIPPAKEEDLLSWVRNILLGDDDGEGEEEQPLQQQQWEQENIVSLSAFLGPMNEACHETIYVEPPATYGESAKEEDLLSWVRNILLGEEEEQLQQQQQWEQENIVSLPSSSQAGGVLRSPSPAGLLQQPDIHWQTKERD